jgi:predicted phosphodiesterase
MRLGIVADIHANLPALRAVLDRLERDGIDRLLVAGDLVGYGAHPNECVEVLVEAGAVMVAGNHDLYACDRLVPRRLPEIGRRALERTREHLRDDVVEVLRGLPLVTAVGDVVIAHGSLADVEEYVTTPAQADHQLQLAGRRDASFRTVALGHTHHQWLHAPPEADRRPARPVTLAQPATAHLLNPGSVGQSRQRERTPAARFVLLDTAARTVAFEAIDYDTTANRRALAEAGLPSSCMHLVPPRTRRLRRVVRRSLARVRSAR